MTVPKKLQWYEKVRGMNLQALSLQNSSKILEKKTSLPELINEAQ